MKNKELIENRNYKLLKGINLQIWKGFLIIQMLLVAKLEASPLFEVRFARFQGGPS